MIKGLEGAAGGLPWPAAPRNAETPKDSAAAGRSTAAVAAQPRTPATESALSAQAPEGVDPKLWNVLTSEERVFFARFRSLGPLTYTPATRAAPQALPRGGRIDVTV